MPDIYLMVVRDATCPRMTTAQPQTWTLYLTRFAEDYLMAATIQYESTLQKNSYEAQKSECHLGRFAQRSEPRSFRAIRASVRLKLSASSAWAEASSREVSQIICKVRQRNAARRMAFALDERILADPFGKLSSDRLGIT
jgi:hypothetical protein